MLPLARTLNPLGRKWGGGLTGPQTIVYATFTAPDGTLVSTYTPDIAPVGSSFIPFGSFGDGTINSNKVCGAGTNNGQWYIETGYSDCDISLDFSSPSSGAYNIGMILRYISAGNYISFWADGTYLLLSVVVDGVETLYRYYSHGGGLTRGAHTMRVVLNGALIQMYFDGTLRNQFAVPAHTTGTKHGLWLTASTLLDNTIDNFQVQVTMPYATPPSYQAPADFWSGYSVACTHAYRFVGRANLRDAFTNAVTGKAGIYTWGNVPTWSADGLYFGSGGYGETTYFLGHGMNSSGTTIICGIASASFYKNMYYNSGTIQIWPTHGGYLRMASGASLVDLGSPVVTKAVFAIANSKFYVNGAYLGESPQSALPYTASPGGPQFGGVNANPTWSAPFSIYGYPIYGHIYAVAYFPGELSQAEITAIGNSMMAMT